MKKMALGRRTVEVIDAYWAGSFGLPAEALRPQRTLIVPHAPDVGFDGIYAMGFGTHPVIAVPGGRLPALQSSLSGWCAATIADVDRARASLGHDVSEVIGPAWLGYADAGSFGRPNATSSARLLDERDTGAVRALRESCAPLDWEHGGSGIGRDPMAGSFENGELTAVAGYETWGDRIAHVAVITHPDRRGRGHGRAAVVAIARHALSKHLVLQYRTLESNLPSRRIAESLGFVQVATSLAVRFRQPQ